MEDNKNFTEAELQIERLKRLKEEKDRKEAKPFDWDKFVTRILALFTTLALIQAYVK